MGQRLSVIATRTGDDGSTGLGDGSRTPKNSLRIHAMGEVDELNCQLGALRAFLAGPRSTNPSTDPESAIPGAGAADSAGVDLAHVDALLLEIQHDLFDLGGELCIPGFENLREAQLLRLDEALALYNADLPRLAEFILPGGSMLAAQAHVCRAVCRRAERAVVALARSEALRALAQQYLNRLSDLLFVLSRVLNRAAGSSDVLWDRGR
ncbi:MAG: cob(I)yrinic acid a,c-diamide adenosyltransferase [Betaproteobacteria bacterium]